MIQVSLPVQLLGITILGSLTQSQTFNAEVSLNAKGGTETTFTGKKTTEDFDSNKNTDVVAIAPKTTTGELTTTSKETNDNQNVTKATADFGGSGTLKYTDVYATTLALKNRIIELSGSLADSRIILRQESGPGLDLSGNVNVLVEYTLTDDWKSARFSKFAQLYTSGRPLTIDSLKNDYLTVIFPDLQTDVIGEMSYQFLYRQVKKGGRHIPEARQKVTYLYGQIGNSKDTKKITTTLIKPSDVRPRSYNISDNGGIPLQVNGKAIPFETALDAESFLHYLGALVTTPGSDPSKVTLRGIALDISSFESLAIKTTQL